MIRNITKKTTVSESAKVANGIADKIFGMILNKNHEGLIFKTNFGIHTFFMKKSIDVLILDQLHMVVSIKKELTPGRIFIWNPKYNLAIELPGGAIERSKTKIGDKLDF